MFTSLPYSKYSLRTFNRKWSFQELNGDGSLDRATGFMPEDSTVLLFTSLEKSRRYGDYIVDIWQSESELEDGNINTALIIYSISRRHLLISNFMTNEELKSTRPHSHSNLVGFNEENFSLYLQTMNWNSCCGTGDRHEFFEIRFKDPSKNVHSVFSKSPGNTTYVNTQLIHLFTEPYSGVHNFIPKAIDCSLTSDPRLKNKLVIINSSNNEDETISIYNLDSHQYLKNHHLKGISLQALGY